MASARAARAMDLDGTIKRHDGPRFEGNPLSRLTFWPATRIISSGGKTPVERSDLWTLEPDDMSIHVWRKFKGNWKLELNEAEPSLFRAVRRTFGWMWLHSFILQIFSAVLTFVTPIFLPYILEYIRDKNMAMWYGYTYAALVVCASIMSAFFFYHASLISWNLGLRIRSALSILIYKKTLCLAPEKNRNSGEIVNLISSDAQQILDTLQMFTQGSTGPFMIILTIILLWQQIGAYSLIPLGVLVVSIPLDVVLGAKVGFWKDKQQAATDNRVKLVKELISAIRIVKSYAWERPFQKNLTEARQEELDAIFGSHRTLAGLIFIITDVPPIGILLTFILYGLFATDFSTSRVFTSLTLLNQMRQPFIFLPIGISTGLQNKVALDRIQAFALKPELPKKKKQDLTQGFGSGLPADVRIQVKNATFSWANDPAVPHLSNLDMSVKNGELYMAIGRVGSGKSTLVNALLGEAPCVSGSVEINGSVAYVSQEAWIVNGTVRDNILFGRPMNQRLYKRVIKAAALDVDLAQMPAQDLTEIGDRGTNLSGGQKQRVSIARALYCDRDIYILDDPFSAVDSHVAHHLFVHAVDGFIRETGKTAVVITNQLQFLPMADHIIMLQQGNVVERGSFEYLKSNGKQFGLLVAEFGVIDSDGTANMRRNRSTDLSDTALILADIDETLEKRADSDGEINLLDGLSYAERAARKKDGAGEKNKLLAEPPRSPISPRVKKSRRTGSKDSTGSRGSESSGAGKLDGNTAINGATGDAALGNLTGTEQREIGSSSPYFLAFIALFLTRIAFFIDITTEIYWYYMKGGSIAMLLFVLITCLLGNVARIIATMFLSNWTNDRELRQHSKEFYIWMFAAFSVGEVMFVGLHLIGFINFAIRASGALHGQLVGSILRATSSFFDATPMGRLMSRFAKDISLVDLVLPLQFDQYINMLFTLISIIVLVAVGSYYVVFVAIPVLLGYFFLTNFYRKTSIEIQRLESLSRAPVFSHLNETIEGTSIIRSYDMVKSFKIANFNKLDINTVDFYALRYCNMWLGLRLDWMGTLLLTTTWFGIVVARNYGAIDESLAGVALSSAVGLTFILSNLSMNATETETRMNSVERIRQYTNVAQEADEIVDFNRTPTGWPAEGKIQMNNVVVSYNKREQILKSMTCVIRPREKVGVVGRTGAGKSTLMAALLRLVEPSSGQIIIDGVDVLGIGLNDLRSKLSIIPQTPTMFIGTVRYNLDPFDEHTDPELWQALEMVQLHDYISNLAGGLFAPVEENGGNFSVGQRQLLAMARALVRNSNILLLDEATAAVDTETDAMIQRMIRTIFKDKTVITIAHRLNTIMDSDRVMVLDKGEIREFDSPKKLLENPQGIFTGMVEATGPSSAEHLRKIANGELSVVEAIVQENPAKRRRGSTEDALKALEETIRRTSLEKPPVRSVPELSSSPASLPAMSPGISSPIQMSSKFDLMKDSDDDDEESRPSSPSKPTVVVVAPNTDDEAIL